MKIFKQVTGILSIVLFVFVLFQSCSLQLYSDVTGTGNVDGISGVIVAICLIVGGIVGIATRNTTGRSGSITCAIFYLLGAFIGFTCAGIFGDLQIWATISLVFGMLHVIFAIKPQIKK